MSKDLLVISLPDRLHTATSTQGMVEVYRKVSNQWVLEDVLFQSLEAEKGDFGQNIAIHEDIIVVSTKRRGATLDKFNSAEVFQHTLAGWQRVTELRAGNSAYDPAFTNNGGSPVDVSNSTIAIWQSTVAVGAVPEVEGVLAGVYIFELAGL